jgi:hypothetical protein
MEASYFWRVNRRFLTPVRTLHASIMLFGTLSPCNLIRFLKPSLWMVSSHSSSKPKSQKGLHKNRERKSPLSSCIYLIYGLSKLKCNWFLKTKKLVEWSLIKVKSTFNVQNFENRLKLDTQSHALISKCKQTENFLTDYRIIYRSIFLVSPIKENFTKNAINYRFLT